MAERNCLSCKGEHEKKKIATVTMSEAAWDRNEERHRKEKNLCLIVAIVSSVIVFATNAIWLFYVGQLKKNDRVEKNTVEAMDVITQKSSNENHIL